MKKFLYIVWSKFLTFFGDIKVFKYPLFTVYDPEDYQVTGQQILEIAKSIQNGDILLRGYNNYLDGKFIPSFKNESIGKGFSHGAIYVGSNTVVHAVAEGVSKINLLDFLQCDRVAVFRPKSGQAAAIKTAKRLEKENVPYDFSFKNNSSALYCFELVAECYSKLDIKTKTVSKLFGLIKKKDVYVAQSFIESKDLELKFCWNPKSGILYKKFKK